MYHMQYIIANFIQLDTEKYLLIKHVWTFHKYEYNVYVVSTLFHLIQAYQKMTGIGDLTQKSSDDFRSACIIHYHF